jgi:ribosomal protein L11 methyltransferase
LPLPVDWLEASAIVAREATMRAERLLQAAGAISVTLQDAQDHPVLEPAPGEAPLWPTVTVIGLFHGDTDPLALLATLHGGIPGARWHISSLAEQLWEREWLRDFQPLRFGRLAVVPTDLEAPPDAIVLRLDPGLAFGTGTHPTTGLCLEWLAALSGDGGTEGLPLAGALVLDYGCGSGILAIAALLLGASEAIAVDIDPQALLATRANATLNQVAARLRACAPDALPAALDGRKSEILMANILARPLLSLLPQFATMVSPGGMIALSGILPGQESTLVSAAAQWFRFDSPVNRDGWVRLSGQRTSAD